MAKKKVMFSADQESWEGIQSLLRQNHIPRTFFNAILNMFVRKQFENLGEFIEEKKKKEGGLTQLHQYQYMGLVMHQLDVHQMELFDQK